MAAGTPFESYLIPGSISAWPSAAAAWGGMDHAPPPDRARAAAFGAAAVTVSWILAQVAMIGYRSPLQPLVAATGLALAYLAARPRTTGP